MMRVSRFELYAVMTVILVSLGTRSQHFKAELYLWRPAMSVIVEELTEFCTSFEMPLIH